MQSRRDQIHSYQFFLHRVISGLIARQPDPAELPFRRLGGAALGSFMVAALMLAAVGVYGIIAGGGATSWKKGSFVILVKDSGARYVYRNGVLHPVVNFTSARLVLGQAAKTKSVSSKSLKGVPRGPQLGIPGAPDILPARKDLLGGGWTLCTTTGPDGKGNREAHATLLVGVPARTAGTRVDAGLLVRDGDDVALLWNNHRFAITHPATLRVFNARSGDALPVAHAWLDVLPEGRPLDELRITDPGAQSLELNGKYRSGQVLKTQNGAFLLVRTNRVDPITPLQKDILLASDEAARAYQGAPIEPIPVDEPVRESDPSGEAPGLATPPRERPALAAVSPADQADGAACADFARGEHVPAVRVGARPPDGGLDTTGVTTSGGLLADRVLVSPGRAALVRSSSAPESTGGSLHLVTDQGMRYALAAPEVARMLGYTESQAVPLPSKLLARIPSGPTLDPVTASRPT